MKLFKNMSKRIGVFALLAIFLSLNSAADAQVVRGRTTDAGTIYYYTATGEVVNALASIVIDEDFLKSTLDVALWDTSGNSASGAAVTFADTVGGAMIITTGGADDDDFEIGTDEQIYLGDNAFGFEVKLRITDVSGVAFFIGMADSANYGSVDTLAFGLTGTTVYNPGGVSNAVGFVYDPDATTDYIYGVNINAGTAGSAQSATVTANNVTPTDLSIVTLRCEVDRDGTAEWFVNDNTLGNRRLICPKKLKMEVPRKNPLRLLPKNMSRRINLRVCPIRSLPLSRQSKTSRPSKTLGMLHRTMN